MAPSYMSPNAGGGGVVSANEHSQIIYGDLTTYLTYCDNKKNTLQTPEPLSIKISVHDNEHPSLIESFMIVC
jgi:hypothetical protein